MQILKFNHYEEVQLEYELCKGLDDIYPYKLILPAAPRPEKIINFGRPAHEQIFQRTIIPKEIKRLNTIPREQAILAVDNDPKLADFIETMWYKMLFGEWQYINGKPLHFSPTYWFYLNFWKMDIGLPDFRWDDEHYCTDLWNFAWWDYLVVPSDVCFGEISGACRRDGKCLGFNTPIRMYDGSIKMVQDIVEGDLVMGDDSTPRKAFGITSGKEKMYRIIPKRGEPFTCNKSHILHLYYNGGSRNAKNGWDAKSKINITVEDYVKLSDSDKNNLLIYRVMSGTEFLKTPDYIEIIIEDIGDGDYYGFAVDGNHLFLLADGTVVHNSYRAACKAYRRIIMGRMSNCSIQSKNEKDALNMFIVKMVNPWMDLPFFFRPYHSSGSYPGAEGFKFTPKSERGKSETQEIIIPENFLMSTIKTFNSAPIAIDGPKWQIHISEEDGKAPVDVDVWERHNVLKPALTDRGKIIGKEISTTTVEDMDKTGSPKFKYKFEMSNRDPNRPEKDRTVDKFGMTTSGLWPWVNPAYCSMVWDKYGKAIVNEPTAAQQKWLKSKGDKFYFQGGKERVQRIISAGKTASDRMQLTRKYANTVKEMFISSSSYCHFDAGIILERLKYFTFGYPESMRGKMTFGNFVDKNVFGGDVEFIACDEENARWHISYLPGVNIRNKFVVHPVNGKKAPANWNKFSSGADSFKFDTDEVIHKDKMSDGTMTIWADFDPDVDREDIAPDDWVTGDMCAEYLARPDTVKELCMDYARACIFYGMKVIPERNNADVINYFKQWGLENYIQRDMALKKVDTVTFLAEKSSGVNTDVSTIQSYFKNVQWYVKEKGMRCKFPRTLRQLLEVSPDNMNPYDLFISLATCLRVVQDFNPIRFANEEHGEDIGDIFASLNPTMPTDSIYEPQDGGDFYS